MKISTSLMRRRALALTRPGSNGGLPVKASAARSRGDWSADIYFRRMICERNPQSGGVWVQYGHALKEAGLYAEAEKAYRQAFELKPADPEIPLQLGHLAKVAGRFEEAAERFSEAKSLGHPDAAAIDGELSKLRRADRGRIFPDAPRSGQRSGVHVYLSVPSGRIVESDKQAVGANLAAADYSYAFAMRGFIQALEALGISHSVIRHPEFVSDIRLRSSAAVNIHLGFYPPESIRLLKGAYNINCCAWEFDRLRNEAETISYHAFANPVSMLNLADEVWAPAESAAEAIRASGVSVTVRMVTSPVIGDAPRGERKARLEWSEAEAAAHQLSEISWQPLAVMPRVQPAASDASFARRSSLLGILNDNEGEGDRAPPIFLSIFNIHDMRKNVRAMIEGFLAFSRDHPDALLLLKVSTPSRGVEPVNKLLFEEQLFVAGDMFPPLVSERVWLTDQVLTREEMNHLYDLASFYVCTSHGEGQNLPLVEAMGRGLTPISVGHTAMADYIRPDNAVVIASKQDVFDRRLTRRYGMYGARTFYSSAADVAAALAAAAALPDHKVAEKSASAIQTVGDHFGVAPFEAAINEVIFRLTQNQEVAA